MTAKQRYVFIVCALSCFVSPLMITSLNLSTPFISSEFQSGAATVTWVVTAYSLGLAIFSIPLGHFADVKGRKFLMTVCSATMVVTTLIAALAPSIEVLIVARFIMSAGAAGMMASNNALLLLAFPPERKGRMLGYSAAFVSLGMTMGPVVGGVVNDLLSWRWIFIIAFFITLLIFVLTVLRIDSDQARVVESYDSLGASLIMAAIFSILFGLSEWALLTWAPLCTVGGFALLVLFVVHELRCDHPVLQVRFFVESRTYARANVIAMLKTLSTFAVQYSIPIYLEVTRGLDASFAGFIMLSMPIMQVCISPFAGALADRFRSMHVMMFGVAVLTVGLFLLSMVDTNPELWFVIVALLVAGLGNALFMAPNNSVVMACVEPSHYSEANATLTTMRALGTSSSVVFVGLILSLTVGNTVLTQVAPDQLAFAVHTVMMACFGFAAFATVYGLLPIKDEKGVQ